MPMSEVQIVNMALARIGVLKPITALTENSTEAIAAKLFYEHIRDDLLTRWPWPWATRRASLAQLSGVIDTTVDAYQYAYSLPADCLRVRSVWYGDRNPSGRAKAEYELRLNGDVAVLLCDLDTVVLVYTARVTDPNQWHSAFTDALAWTLADELSRSLESGRDVSRQAEMARQRAAAVALASVQQDPMPDSEIISVRGGYVGRESDLEWP